MFVCLIRDASVTTGNGDRFVLDLVKQSAKPSLLLLKQDRQTDGQIEAAAANRVVSSGARVESHCADFRFEGDQIEQLLAEMMEVLPEGEALFAADEYTDQSVRVIAREKSCAKRSSKRPAKRFLTSPAVVTERWEEVREDFTRIYCAIFVERDSQKRIVIGHGAQRLKQIGMRARSEIEKMLGHRCHLELFVKVEEHWREPAAFAR
jgi:GTP-binding protein Era